MQKALEKAVRGRRLVGTSKPLPGIYCLQEPAQYFPGYIVDRNQHANAQDIFPVGTSKPLTGIYCLQEPAHYCLGYIVYRNQHAIDQNILSAGKCTLFFPGIDCLQKPARHCLYELEHPCLGYICRNHHAIIAEYMLSVGNQKNHCPGYSRCEPAHPFQEYTYIV